MKDTNKKLNKIANDYAIEKGYKNARDMNDTIANGLNSKDMMTNATYDKQYRLVTEELLPMMFHQIVLDAPSYGMLQNMIDRYYIGVKDEGNGFSISDILITGPTHTNPITAERNNFIPDANTIAKSKPIVQGEQVNFFTPDSTPEDLKLAPEAYAFYKDLTINNVIYKQHWKKGAGVQFLARQAAVLYQALVFYRADKILSTLFVKDADWSKNPNCLYTVNAATAYECWVDIIKKIEDFLLLSNKYNYDAEKKRISASTKDSFRIYVHPETKATLESGILTQLFNTQYLSKGILDKLETLPTKKLKVNPQSNIWETTDEDYIAKDEIYIIENKAFIDARQSFENAGQFFARNLESYSMVYTVHACKYIGFHKVLKIKAANINNNI